MKIASAVTSSLEEVLFLASVLLSYEGIPGISAQFQPKPQSKQAKKKILTFVIRNSVRSMKVASPSLEDWLFPASFGELPFDEDLFEDGRKRE